MMKRRHLSSTACLRALLCMTAILLAGCNNPSHADDTSHSSGLAKLSLIAYNYTDHTISDYYVNGAWGGNVAVSNVTSGGGGGTCCVLWKKNQKLPVAVHVRWVSHMCTYKKKVDGQLFTRYKAFYDERDIKVTKVTSNDPEYFETHFYPDGHIEAAVTSDYTPPRLKLPVTKKKPRRRPGATPIPRCTPQQIKQKNG